MRCRLMVAAAILALLPGYAAGDAEPEPARLYTFELAEDGATSVPNMKGEKGSLKLARAGRKEFSFVEGRRPGTKAMRLDRGCLETDAFEVKENSFTVEAWVRTHGLGAVKGDSVPKGATLLSAGTLTARRA